MGVVNAVCLHCIYLEAKINRKLFESGCAFR